MTRPSSEILDGLEADGILRVIGHAEIDPDAALFVLEETVAQLLEVLGPLLVADEFRLAPALLASRLPALRDAAHLAASALLVHQMAREVSE